MSAGAFAPPAWIVQRSLPHTPWDDSALARMPGMTPVVGPWIVVDDAYAAQMAERARLMRERPDDVTAVLPEAEDALEELRDVVVADLPPGFRREGGAVRRPDGEWVALAGAPFAVLNRLLQEDLLLLLPRDGEHVLVAGLLCFPANWTLAEKIGRPLVRIHRPIPAYDAALARRVQRLFDHARPGRPMWRANVLAHRTAELFHAKPEGAPREDVARPPPFVRSERQTVLRLPRTGAVLFAVHTWIVPFAALTAEQRARCPLAGAEGPSRGRAAGEPAP